MLHLFHRWETETKGEAEASMRSILGKRVENVEVLIVIERCAKCGKRRAFALQFGLREKVDVRLADHLLAHYTKGV